MAIIAKRLNMRFQPNHGSSLYKRPSRKKVIPEQVDWDSPIGTLRLSDHWNYENHYGDTVYKTDEIVPERTWVLAVNKGLNRGRRFNPWKVLQIFQKTGNVNLIRKINFKEIHNEVDKAIGWHR